MKTVGIILTLFAAFCLTLTIIFGVKSNYEYNKQIKCYWELSDKAATISQKSVQIDKFVTQLENSGLQGKYDAIWLTTPDNSFDENLIAVKTLQSRLHQLDTMDANSFQYNTAIQQITQQEQGEAYSMLSVFSGCWYKEHYILLWNWVCMLQVFIFVVIGVIGYIIWDNES
jgi:hypothetical protein